MKNLNALNLPEDLTLDVQNFICNVVCSNELMLVFYTPVVNSKLKVLTLVVDKQNYQAVVCGDDVVVSINSSEYTLKRYNKKGSKLEALNPEYSHSVVITEVDEVIVLGVVDALIRNIKKKSR